MELKFPFLKKFAVGYFFQQPGHFMDIIRPYIPALAEVYFPLPGILSARELPEQDDKLRAQLFPDLQKARQAGLKLDLLINATCYGEKSYTMEWRKTIEGAIRLLDQNGLKPEVVTTTSPFVAKVIKAIWPEIDIRASVNMKIGSTLAMEYVSDTYDSFYMSRDFQRDIPTMKLFSEWCAKNGKKLCMLVNSGCLRNCPTQIFHETLLSHGFWRAANEASRLKSNATLCWDTFREKHHYEELLRATWIRPEDLKYYAPYVEVFKLSTRSDDLDPDQILRAYTTGHFDGNLLKVLDPNYTIPFGSLMIDNTAFPEDWVPAGIAAKCAINCTHCGKCTTVLNNVLKEDPNHKFSPETELSFQMNDFSIGGYSFN